MSTIALSVRDVAETAETTDNLKIFWAAIRRTNLYRELKKRGPFTIFAPTDQAFDDLPAAVAAQLFESRNTACLARVLAYHIVRGRSSAIELTRADRLKTFNGESLSITFKYGRILVDSARIIEPDIECSNGIMHVTDVVILPDHIGLKT